MINNGTIALNTDSAPWPHSIIVTGVGRSGTSMMSAILTAFGVPMGPDHGLAVHEDQEFRAAIMDDARPSVAELVAQRNAAHPLWGMKLPSLHLHVGSDDVWAFESSRLLIVTRDQTAGASRALLSDDALCGDPYRALMNVAGQMHRLVSWAAATGLPALFVSYEKAITMPQAVLPEVARFCGLTPDAATMARAVATVVPNNPQYIATFHGVAA